MPVAPAPSTWPTPSTSSRSRPPTWPAAGSPEGTESAWAYTRVERLAPGFGALVEARHVAGTGRPETAVPGLFLASASAHPGGAVRGACGANAARAALWHDRGRRLLRVRSGAGGRRER